MWSRFTRFVRASVPVVFVVGLTKKVLLPPFEGLTLYEVITFFFESLRKGVILIRASSLAFNYMLAIFPAIIFLFTLLAYIPIDNFQEELLILLRDVLPRNAYETVRLTVEDLVSERRGSLLSFGFLVALFFSSNGVNSMINAFNTTYKTRSRSMLMQRLVAAVLTIILSVLVITAIALIVFSELAMDFLIAKGILNVDFTYYLLVFGKWITIIALILCAISFLYYLGPAKDTRWRFITAGSTLATVLTLATSVGFSYFVNNFGHYNKVYGSIGTLMVIMLWLHFNSVILLVGFELNASIDKAKKGKEVIT